jgi:hypothetical protein
VGDFRSNAGFQKSVRRLKVNFGIRGKGNEHAYFNG